VNEELKHTQKLSNAAYIIWDVILKIIAYIYDFIFNWEDEPYYGNDFIEDEKLKHAAVQSGTSISKANLVENNATVSIQNEKSSSDFSLLAKVFGIQSASYIARLRDEVDYLVEEHHLVYENSIMVVIPPEKFRIGALGPNFFDAMLERLYSQYDNDVILKIGDINILDTTIRANYAEVEIVAYVVTEELLASV